MDEFINWAKSHNFNGRWLPETNGSTDFLWNEYPWSDSFKNMFSEDDLIYRFGNSDKYMIRSYMGQLQENYGGMPEDDRRLTTAYMPNPKIMEVLNLHVSERGITKDKTEKIISQVIYRNDNPYHGLLLRKEALLSYLRSTGQVFVSCICGEKSRIVGTTRIDIMEYSGAFGISQDGTLNEIRILQKVN